MPSRVQACCDRSNDAASTALEANDWYSESDRLGACCCSSTGSGPEAEILEGSPDGFVCWATGDSRATGVASLVDGWDSFCFLGAGAAALGGRPGPRFSPAVDSTIFACISSSRQSHILVLKSCRQGKSATLHVRAREHVIEGDAEFVCAPPK